MAQSFYGQQDGNVDRHKSPCFVATSREQRANTLASRTNPPEVGRYRPRHSQTEKKGISSTINPNSKNFGTERILQRELQHSYICPHTLKVLTDKESRPKSILLKEKAENIDVDSRISKEDFREPDVVEGLVSLNITKDLELKIN